MNLKAEIENILTTLILERELSSSHDAKSRRFSEATTRLLKLFRDETMEIVNEVTPHKSTVGRFDDPKDGSIDLMTGREWYERFEKELVNPPLDYGECRDLSLRAAKRAAGIE